MTINWNVNIILAVTEGATNVVLFLSWFESDTVGPPAIWSHENLREPPDGSELLLPSRTTRSDRCTFWLGPALAIGIVFAFVELLLLPLLEPSAILVVREEDELLLVVPPGLTVTCVLVFYLISLLHETRLRRHVLRSH